MSQVEFESQIRERIKAWFLASPISKSSRNRAWTFQVGSFVFHRQPYLKMAAVFQLHWRAWEIWSELCSRSIYFHETRFILSTNEFRMYFCVVNITLLPHFIKNCGVYSKNSRFLQFFPYPPKEVCYSLADQHHIDKFVLETYGGIHSACIGSRH